MLQIRLKLGGGCRKFPPTVASLIKLLPRTAQEVFDLNQPRAHLLRFELQQTGTSLADIAFRLELDQLLSQLLILALALRDLGDRSLHLGVQGVGAITHFADECFDTLEQRGSRTMAFFESCDAGGSLRRGVGGRIAPGPQTGEALLPVGRLQLTLGAPLLDGREFRLPRGDQALLFLTFTRKPA